MDGKSSTLRHRDTIGLSAYFTFMFTVSIFNAFQQPKAVVESEPRVPAYTACVESLPDLPDESRNEFYQSMANDGWNHVDNHNPCWHTSLLGEGFRRFPQTPEEVILEYLENGFEITTRSQAYDNRGNPEPDLVSVWKKPLDQNSSIDSNFAR